MKTRDIVLGVLAVIAILFIIWQSDEEEKSQPPEVTVYVSEKRQCSAPVLKAFERKTGVRVHAVYFDTNRSGERTMMRLLEDSHVSKPDVFWVTDPFTAQLIRQKNIAVAYRSHAAEKIPERFKDEQGYWTGFAARARVFIVNGHAQKRPVSLSAYTDPAFRDHAAIAGMDSKMTAMQIAALFTRWGDERGRAFMRAMNANGVTYTDSDNASADFVANGTFDFALVDSDVALHRLRAGAPVSIVAPDQGKGQIGAMLVPDTAGMVRGGSHHKAARQLIDFLLSSKSQRALAFSECALIPLAPGVDVPKDLAPFMGLHPMDVNVTAVTKKRTDMRVKIIERSIR